LLQINKLLIILTLSQFLLACDDITPNPLVSSPDRTLTDNVLVSAQVATGETVAYDLPAVSGNINGNIYEVRVKRAGGSNPVVLVCDAIENCPSPGVGVTNPDSTFDGTVKWYLVTSNTTLYTYVGDASGEESQYSITAGIDPTNVEGTALTAVNIYGAVKSGETANYTLAVSSGNDYQITATTIAGFGAIEPVRACLELDCTTTVTLPYSADFTGILYVFVDSLANNSLFSIKADDLGPTP